MKTKHTAGVWKVVHPFIATENDTVVARVMSTGDDVSPLRWQCESAADTENCANAELLAAAPKLLTMLVKMVESYGRLHDGLSDMLGDGEGSRRLSEEMIPEDYSWLVETLSDLAPVSDEATQIVKGFLP